MKKSLLLAFAFFSLHFVFAQIPNQLRTYYDDPNLPRRDHPLDFERLSLEIWPDGATGMVRGKVTHYFHCLRPAVDSFFLDAIKMDVQAMSLNGQPARYRVDSAGITVYASPALQWEHTDSLTIEYTAHPSRGLYFIGWNDPRGMSRKQMWSQGEGIDNRYWIPLYDEMNDKVQSEMTVHYDSGYQVLSNGKLVSHGVDAAGLGVWHYSLSHPQAPYLIMLGIGKYGIEERRSASGVPLHLYYYPEWKNRVAPTYLHSADAMDFYEKEIGVPFPWESYSQIPVQDYMFGAMENTTATVFGDFYMVDSRGSLDRTYISVNAHELAHQWFGDYVTASSGAGSWLQESFATYYAQLFEREVFGADHFAWGQRGSGNAALEDSKHNVLGVAHSESGGNRVYGKGAYVLDMLKYVLGSREAYNKAVHHYLNKHGYGNVDSHDLLEAVEESSGMSLEWFWDEWLYRGGEPNYRVDLYEEAGGIEWVITQHPLPGGVTGYKDGLFRMPVVLEAHYTDGSVTQGTVRVEHATEVLRMPKPAGKTLAYALFDPASHILKTVSFPKPASMLLAQATDAEAMIDRYDALVALRGTAVGAKHDVLLEVFRRDRFFATRVEALNQLAADTSGSATALIRIAMGDSDVVVRKAALATVDAYTPRALALLPAIGGLLRDSSYDLVDAALQKLAEIRPEGLKSWLAGTRGMVGVSGRNVEVRWLELSWRATRDEQAARQLVGLCGPGYEFRTRVGAMNALRRMDYFDEQLAANLFDAIFSANTRLSGPATDVLNYFFGQDRWRRTIVLRVRNGHWTAAQQGMLGAFRK
jgi:aminopeptidase N